VQSCFLFFFLFRSTLIELMIGDRPATSSPFTRISNHTTEGQRCGEALADEEEDVLFSPSSFGAGFGLEDRSLVC
jgi:hypothetical protein